LGVVDAFDTTVAQPARRYNYWLGGKDHFQADRESGDAIEAIFPTIRMTALENRGFLRRATRFLTAEAGIRQFLDIGTGLPAPDNTHEVAQAIAPETRVVYVDNDPIVMSHARTLMNGTSQGRTTYLEADLREPASILEHPQLKDALDLSRPVGLLLIAVLHFIPGDAQPIVRELLDALPPGSWLAVSNATVDYAPSYMRAAHDELLRTGKSDVQTRTRAQFAAIFEGLEVVEPGITVVSDWRAEAESQPRPEPVEIGMYAAVGRVC
jgi:trans-aconitate methyltransferase